MDVEALEPVRYYLDMDTEFLIVNEALGRKIKLRHTGYECKICGSDEPVYRMGMCKKCFFESPYAGDWIVHPELSKAHLEEEDRDLEVEKAVQLQPHYVYLAHTSGIKVGVTRREQVPNRWIDQGACEALVLMEVPNRYLAGITEVALKQHIADKTDWRRMLKSDSCEGDLRDTARLLEPYVPEETRPYLLKEPLYFRFTYPVNRIPSKIKSLKLAQTGAYEGVLTGMKGQYWIFEDGTVFNVRNHEGFRVELTL
ncbi:MAG: DUF2797 domain-containing protein [Chlorobi bacterium]|nr:DUF2797 domain-containing protein [Chlorobiota bacterium]